LREEIHDGDAREEGGKEKEERHESLHSGRSLAPRPANCQGEIGVSYWEGKTATPAGARWCDMSHRCRLTVRCNR
jgi:hypothetical protein